MSFQFGGGNTPSSVIDFGTSDPVHTQIETSGFGTATTTDEKELKQQILCLEGLPKDIGKLFNEEEHADVTVKCGETSFSVHRYILAAGSEVFSAMFQHDMSEKNTGIVDIVDLDANILELLLRFLYTGKVQDMSIDKALELYQAAGRYSVNTLKQFCVSYILENMSKEKVSDVLLLADKAGDIKFFDDVASLAANIKGLLNSQNWKDFAEKFPKVAVKVYLNYFNRV